MVERARLREEVLFRGQVAERASERPSRGGVVQEAPAAVARPRHVLRVGQQAGDSAPATPKNGPMLAAR